MGIKAPSQVITYVSAHDNQTLWDKLAETMPGTDETERMRLNRMAAALYMTCQGNLFLHDLSGEFVPPVRRRIREDERWS